MHALIFHLGFWTPQAGLETGHRFPGSKLVELPKGISSAFEAAAECFTVDNHPEPEFATAARVVKRKRHAYSLSVGDVVKVGKRYFLCAPVGWKEINQWDFRRRFHRVTGTFWKIQDGIDRRSGIWLSVARQG